MCIRDRVNSGRGRGPGARSERQPRCQRYSGAVAAAQASGRCLLYTSDAADERSSVDLGGRRIIKKKTNNNSGKSPHENVKQDD